MKNFLRYLLLNLISLCSVVWSFGLIYILEIVSSFSVGVKRNGIQI